jgi:hypothetical protein
MNSCSNSLMRFTIVLVAASAPLFAGLNTVAPEPSLVVLTAVGVGALVLIARKRRGR